MPELVAVFAGSTLLGVAVARWWLVPVPFVLCALWTVGAAVAGGVDGDGMPYWEIALFVGGFLAFAAALGLTAGVIWGRWLRERGAWPTRPGAATRPPGRTRSRGSGRGS
jgi:hypothetical protein